MSPAFHTKLFDNILQEISFALKKAATVLKW